MSVSISRNSDDYTASKHCLNHLKCNQREIQPWMVNKTIETGEVCKIEESGVIKLKAKLKTQKVTVTINPESYTVITATNVSQKLREARS